MCPLEDVTLVNTLQAVLGEAVGILVSNVVCFEITDYTILHLVWFERFYSKRGLPIRHYPRRGKVVYDIV